MTRRSKRQGAWSAAAATLIVALVSGCGVQVPADPDGTLQRVSGGVLRVGASVDDPFVILSSGDVSGPLADATNRFAEHHDARVEWTIGSEETLVNLLEEGVLDLAIGGMTSDSPWADRTGVTRAYTNVPGVEDRETVMLVPLGENRFLAAVEAHLDTEFTP